MIPVPSCGDSDRGRQRTAAVCFWECVIVEAVCWVFLVVLDLLGAQWPSGHNFFP
jgi:hypothetical protein